MKAIYRIIGFLVLIAAIAGFLFSVAGLVGLWQYKPRLSASTEANLDLMEQTLSTTADGLALAEQSLDGTIASVDALEDTINATADTLETSAPLIENLSTLTSKDLPEAVTLAQTSLDSAQQSARIIDSVLRALSALPGIDYAPAVPLHTSLQQVSESLNNIPASLSEMNQSLDEAAGNIEVIQADVALMAGDIRNIHDSLEESKLVIEDYQALVGELQQRQENLSTGLPQMINNLVWVLTGVLVWALIIQLGLILLSLDWMINRRVD